MLFHGFPWHRLYVHLIANELSISLPMYFRLPDGFISIAKARIRAGVLWDRIRPIRGFSILESLRGFTSYRESYPRYHPRRIHVQRREGFTDLSRLIGRCRHRSGQCYLPDKEFRSIFPRCFQRSRTLS